MRGGVIVATKAQAAYNDCFLLGTSGGDRSICADSVFLPTMTFLRQAFAEKNNWNYPERRHRQWEYSSRSSSP